MQTECAAAGTDAVRCAVAKKSSYSRWGRTCNINGWKGRPLCVVCCRARGYLSAYQHQRRGDTSVSPVTSIALSPPPKEEEEPPPKRAKVPRTKPVSVTKVPPAKVHAPPPAADPPRGRRPRTPPAASPPTSVVGGMDPMMMMQHGGMAAIMAQQARRPSELRPMRLSPRCSCLTVATVGAAQCTCQPVVRITARTCVHRRVCGSRS